MLYKIVGDRKKVNSQIVALALAKAPSLMVDSANCADIHGHKGSLEDLSRLHVLPAESLYRFLPTIKSLERFAGILRTKNLFITTFTHLFNYDDKEEDLEVFNSAWEHFSYLSDEFDVYVGVEVGTVHEELAQTFGAEHLEHTGHPKRDHPRKNTMGHTVRSQRIATDMLLGELRSFSKVLRENDNEIFQRLIKKPLKHMGSISYTSSHSLWAFVAIAMMIEQEKTIDDINKKIRGLEHVVTGRIQEKRQDCPLDKD